jgi:hypothetical protein
MFLELGSLSLRSGERYDVYSRGAPITVGGTADVLIPDGGASVDRVAFLVNVSARPAVWFLHLLSERGRPRRHAEHRRSPTAKGGWKRQN